MAGPLAASTRWPVGPGSPLAAKLGLGRGLCRLAPQTRPRDSQGPWRSQAGVQLGQPGPRLGGQASEFLPRTASEDWPKGLGPQTVYAPLASPGVPSVVVTGFGVAQSGGWHIFNFLQASLSLALRADAANGSSIPVQTAIQCGGLSVTAARNVTSQPAAPS